MIKGKLINLRFPEPADHLKLVKWRNENLQYFFGDEPVSMENHLDWYERVSHDASQRFFVVTVPKEREVFVVTVPRERGAKSGEHQHYTLYDDTQAVGTIGLANIDFRHRRAEYGRLLIAEEHRGKGYGKNALTTLLRFAFVTLGLHKVYGEILTRNSEAFSLCESLGFHRGGYLVDHVFKEGRFWNVTRVAILADSWESQR